ncbi:MAG: hypothetical protein U9N87_00315 [Planctomycetota bacterium]|nr:hypothetical protein [Planctomycetota bacterium]
MPRHVFVFMAMLALALPPAAPRSSEAFELFHRRHHQNYPSAAHAAPRYQQAARWYPEYRPMPGDNFGGGVPTYAYGYFGAKAHSSYGCHRGYYGDLYTWGPLRGR